MNYVYDTLNFMKKLLDDDQKLITSADNLDVASITTNGLAAEMSYSVCNEFYSYNKTISSVAPFYYHYLVIAMIDTIIEDTIVRDPVSGKAFEIEISEENKDKKKIEAAVRAFQRDFDLDKLVADNIYDAIFYGEYPFRLQVKKGKGVVALIDNINPGEVICLLKNGVPVQYYELFKDRFRAAEPWNYWSMILSERRMRIESNYTHKLPYRLSVARPFIVPVLPQLMELSIIEIAKVGRKLIDMLRSNLVGVQAPPTLTLKQLSNFKKFYEKLLNDTGGLTSTSTLLDMDITSFQRLVTHLNSKSAQLTVVPYSDERGRIEPITARDQGMEIPQSDIEDKRNSVTSIAGVPYEYVTGKRDEKFASSYRAYVRYTKKVRTFVTNLSWSIRRLIYIHLINAGYKVRMSEIIVKFPNKISSVEIDRLEFLDTEVAMLGNLVDLLDRFSTMEGFEGCINPKETVNFVRNAVSLPALKKVFQTPKPPSPEDTEPEGGTDDEL